MRAKLTIIFNQMNIENLYTRFRYLIYSVLKMQEVMQAYNKSWSDLGISIDFVQEQKSKGRYGLHYQVNLVQVLTKVKIRCSRMI
jgi:hypothetical protein